MIRSKCIWVVVQSYHRRLFYTSNSLLSQNNNYWNIAQKSLHEKYIMKIFFLYKVANRIKNIFASGNSDSNKWGTRNLSTQSPFWEKKKWDSPFRKCIDFVFAVVQWTKSVFTWLLTFAICLQTGFKMVENKIDFMLIFLIDYRFFSFIRPCPHSCQHCV